MIALIIGIVFIAFTVFSLLPMGLGWATFVLDFLKGGLPVLTAFLGLIIVFIGIADIKDKAMAKKEELAEKSETEGSDKN